MKNKKGFTLVELLAMLVVLGILMAVSVPNITGILDNQRANTLVEDANRMVDMLKTRTATQKDFVYPDEGICNKYTLDYLDLHDEIKKGPNGGAYERTDSYVVMTKIKSGTTVQYKYYVRLIEKDDSGDTYGISMVSLEDLEKNGNSFVTASPASAPSTLPLCHY